MKALAVRRRADPMKVAIVERKLLGGTCITGCTPTKTMIASAHAAHMVHSILDVMYAKAPCTVIQWAVHIYPTVSELIPTTLGELQPLSNAAAASR